MMGPPTSGLKRPPCLPGSWDYKLAGWAWLPKTVLWIFPCQPTTTATRVGSETVTVHSIITVSLIHLRLFLT